MVSPLPNLIKIHLYIWAPAPPLRRWGKLIDIRT